MGLFKKKGKPKKSSSQIGPSFPELPKPPQLPALSNPPSTQSPPSLLPRYPPNSIGEKLSQHRIKDAVAGKEEESNPFNEAFPAPETQQKQTKGEQKEVVGVETPRRTIEINEEQSTETLNLQEKEPLFVRIDKFEEALTLFKKVEKQITEIEDALEQIKRVREREDEEISLWEKDLQKVKEEIEKIDQKVFSKIE